MATIELRQVEKRFGDFHAVKPLDLTIQDGEFVTLLGPSGCGKTTTLRMISGLETVTGGDIFLNGEKITWHTPSDRDIAFVFQLFALYPHINVRQNIAFPLQAEGADRALIDSRVDEVVQILRIGHLLNERPGKLSGGDKQRVALARALVRRPAAFLMDEPLGALDAELREAMRAEIKRLHIGQNATTVYVTHDQIEAMAMSDRIVVMSEAEIQQVGSPEEVYYQPSNLFVARFIGSPGMNLAEGSYADGAVRFSNGNSFPVPAGFEAPLGRALGGERTLIMGFRPEAAQISTDGPLAGEVYASDFHGAFRMLHVNLNGDEIIHIRSDRTISYPIGSQVRFNLNPEMTRFFDPAGGKAIEPVEAA
jgi:multiple sugar transport system ATP-binding protein